MAHYISIDNGRSYMTAEEAAKYTEQKAEVMLDRLIYREISKEVR